MKLTDLKKLSLEAEFFGKVSIWSGKDKDGDKRTVVVMQSSAPFSHDKKVKKRS